MIGLIIAGIVSLVLLISGVAIFSVALIPHRLAHFVDNWTKTAEKAWNMQHP